MWSGYVKDHLIKRLFGFELIMAAYAMAHLKLGMQLAAQDLPEEHRQDWAYDFDSDERLGVYLTNTLEQAERQTIRPVRPHADHHRRRPTPRQRSNATLPIMVVLGNPPYSGHSANKGKWILELIDSYKRGFPELQKPAQAKWLSDDYVKFIRFGQHRIQQSGAGILAFITNNSYLDGPTFRGMRLSLMETFTSIFLLDLHGNAKKKERAPDGGADQNVFDIQQGVSIAIFVKEPGESGPAKVYHADLYGTRQAKYNELSASDVSTTVWGELVPKAPLHLFKPRDEELFGEYELRWSIPDIFSLNGTPAPGIVTTHDQFAISWTGNEAEAKVGQLVASDSEEEARKLWKLCSQNQWQYDRAKLELADDSWRCHIQKISYRPFDIRYTVYDKNVAVHRRERVMRHMLAGPNLGLVTCRQQSEAGQIWNRCGVTLSILDECAISNKTREINYLFPLYIYPSEQELAQGLYKPGERQANLSFEFIAELEARLGLEFVYDGCGDLAETLGPEDAFHYIYAVLHSAIYRERYDQFLRADFPRIPLTSDVELFRALAELGARLKNVYLMKSPNLHQAQVSFPVVGDNVIEQGYPKHYAPGDTPLGEKSPVKQGRVYISKTAPRSAKQGQYFEGIPPDVWEFRIGGYQPLKKWLKDRKGRTLSFDDLNHYMRIAAALSETMRLMAEVDEAILESGDLFT